MKGRKSFCGAIHLLWGRQATSALRYDVINLVQTAIQVKAEEQMYTKSSANPSEPWSKRYRKAVKSVILYAKDFALQRRLHALQRLCLGSACMPLLTSACLPCPHRRLLPSVRIQQAIAKTCDDLSVNWQKEYFGAW